MDIHNFPEDINILKLILTVNFMDKCFLYQKCLFIKKFRLLQISVYAIFDKYKFAQFDIFSLGL